MAAGATYEPIATTTLGSATTSYTFSSIPQTYTDLVIVANVNCPTRAANVGCQYNGDTATNYSWTRLYGTGTSAVSSRATTQVRSDFGIVGNTDWSTLICQIQNYSNTTTYKTGLGRGNFAAGYVSAFVNLWRSTSAISSIKLLNEFNENFAAGSTFTLYGIAAA
jgi:hypothetical protein